MRAAVLVLAMGMLGAAPAARLTPARGKLLASRSWLLVDEATLRIELAVYGP
ncbi:MAG: hypothetical protein K2X91_19190 [Thermoleophilia bacterium]|nr:hypothetical protein [Thermoleophilia bacterium]